MISNSGWPAAAHKLGELKRIDEIGVLAPQLGQHALHLAVLRRQTVRLGTLKTNHKWSHSALCCHNISLHFCVYPG